MLDEDYANIVHTLLDFAKRNILDFKQKDNFFKVVMSLKEKTQKQKEQSTPNISKLHIRKDIR